MQDYLNLREAAAYLGVSPNHFRRTAPHVGIEPRKAMGRLCYRFTDIQKYMESLWPPLPPEESLGRSTGPTRRPDKESAASLETRQLLRRVTRNLPSKPSSTSSPPETPSSI